jgi:hypothetical protein
MAAMPRSDGVSAKRCDYCAFDTGVEEFPQYLSKQTPRGLD